jgi:hypothetical protein
MEGDWGSGAIMLEVVLRLTMPIRPTLRAGWAATGSGHRENPEGKTTDGPPAGPLFDHLIRPRQHCRRDREAEDPQAGESSL